MSVDQPTITFTIPCYNSADYMDHCIESILVGADDIEIIIVNDGSTKDNTAEKADEWAARHPDVIRVIHQENKGHGGAVNAGMDAARGVYFRVVDSDDWLDKDSALLLLSKLRRFIKDDQRVDLVVSNYVYEHVNTGTRKVINYLGALRPNEVMNWDDVRRFAWGQNILMHAATYRTDVLRKANLRLPLHTFYVDNLFVYVPMPFVETVFYLPVDLYRYFIGRPDQSVNETVMVTRLDQQIRVTKLMVDAYKLPEDVPSKNMARYMEDYLSLIVAASSTIALLKGTDEALEERRKMWDHIYEVDPALGQRMGRHPLVLGSNLAGPLGRSASLALYRLAQRLYRFN